MPRRPTLSRRLATAAAWPLGVALTSWNYMWRTTPMSRTEVVADDEVAPPPLPPEASRDELQAADDGYGPLFHRVYRVRIADSRFRADDLIDRLARDLNRATPTELARFFKVRGERGRVEPGDEFVVRMPGPWDGPVRVVERTPTSFRLATLDGHLEAGQIRFFAEDDGDDVVVAIESWARSGDRVSNLLYHHLRMAKEIQLHMWTSFLENVVREAGGKRKGRVDIETRRHG